MPHIALPGEAAVPGWVGKAVLSMQVTLTNDSSPVQMLNFVNDWRCKMSWHWGECLKKELKYPKHS